MAPDFVGLEIKMFISRLAVDFSIGFLWFIHAHSWLSTAKEGKSFLVEVLSVNWPVNNDGILPQFCD